MVTFFDSAAAPAWRWASSGSTNTPPAPAASTGPRAPGATPRTGTSRATPIAQGAVDSTIAHHVKVPAEGEKTVYMVIIAGHSREELLELHKWMVKIGPQGVIDRTTSYWRLWVGGHEHQLRQPARRRSSTCSSASLLVVRTQIDNGGAIIAANDSDIMQFSRDTYSATCGRATARWSPTRSTWPASPTSPGGSTASARRSSPTTGTSTTSTTPTARPPRAGTRGSSRASGPCPIQEDETALVVWALWRHYYRYRDIEYIRPLWVDLVQKAADFMVKYRDPRTGLPLPSYDLWEERWGVHAFTVATVYGGLKAARNFAVCFGDREQGRDLQQGRRGSEGRRGEVPVQREAEPLRRGGWCPRTTPRPPDINDYTETVTALDAPTPPSTTCSKSTRCSTQSLYAIFKFHLFEADDPRVVATMQQVEEKLWVKTSVGGVARYENDYYHRISNDIAAVPGNPWFICTLWLADYYITRAKTPAELKLALPIFEWTASHALESGVLAEQVNPYTNEPISVSPLTWSTRRSSAPPSNTWRSSKASRLCGDVQPADLPPAPPRAGGGEEPGALRPAGGGLRRARRPRDGRRRSASSSRTTRAAASR